MQTTPEQEAEFRAETPYFYTVGIPRFVTLWLGTLGFYGLFWFYQHWAVIRTRQNADFTPWHRVLGAGSYCEPLLLEFQRAGEVIPNPQPLRPRLQAVLWLAMTATLFLHPPWSLICPFACLPLIPAQIAANRVSAARTPLAAGKSAPWLYVALALLPLVVTLLAFAVMGLLVSSLGCKPHGLPKPM